MNIAKDIRSNDWRNVFSTDKLLKQTKGDKVIWALVVLLTLVSLLAVYSASGSLAYKKYGGNTEYFLIKQGIFIMAGLLTVYLAHLLNYTHYSKYSLFIYLLSLGLLLYTLFFGVKMNEGTRWIRIPFAGITMQSSDFARLALFIFLARLMSRRQDVIKNFRKGYMPLLVPVILSCLFIAPANLSTAMLLFFSCMLLFFIGRAKMRHLLLTFGIICVPLILLVITAVVRHNKTDAAEKNTAVRSSSVLTARLDTWISRMENYIYGGKEEMDADNYQLNQSKIAISRGGFFGAGPGNSTTRDYLPQAYNDFIYAIIIEEYGLLGGAFIVFIYLVFLYRCIRIFKKCPYAFGSFLALGLSFSLVLQAMANMAVTVGLFPVTGVTLPLVSMGGTSFIFTCLAIGMILSVARNIEQQEGKTNPAIKEEGAETV